MDQLQCDIAVIGGGAAGYFGAIRMAESNPKLSVILFEGTRKPLTKVKISGGGRCNVTHNQFNPHELVRNYPRGHKELLGAFSQFQPRDTVKWFGKRGVTLKAEADGRMFPTTDDSETIISCLRESARKAGVIEMLGEPLKDLRKDERGFVGTLRQERQFVAQKVLLTTGSMPIGHEVAQRLGHTIERLVPSLFTFNIDDSLLKDLAGISFPRAKVKLTFADRKDKFEQQGPVLITHWGLSGPAVLKLSAFAAVPLYDSGYQAKATIHWLGESSAETLVAAMNQFKEANPKKIVSKHDLFEVSGRFWQRLLELVGVDAELRWCDISKKSLQKIAEYITATTLTVCGKGVFKEEFVTCGGVSRREVNFKTLESKVCPGLYFAGEILDVDGITGGFNFQNAWTTSYIAGSHIASTTSAL